MEGSMVNLDVTAPGATLALALMFLKACCAVAVNFSFFFFFLFLSLSANFPLSEAQMNVGQRKEGYYIMSANAIMTWTCTGNFGIV
jgi:hypothetical protein